MRSGARTRLPCPEPLRDDVPDGRCRSAFLSEADAQLRALELAQAPEDLAHLLPVAVPAGDLLLPVRRDEQRPRRAVHPVRHGHPQRVPHHGPRHGPAQHTLAQAQRPQPRDEGPALLLYLF